jgi:hypothetical protein
VRARVAQEVEILAPGREEADEEADRILRLVELLAGNGAPAMRGANAASGGAVAGPAMRARRNGTAGWGASHRFLPSESQSGSTTASLQSPVDGGLVQLADGT